ncbi:MAG TPA: hypothetical protein VD996_06950, partial [Chitinophagaceae bacterium]|nr:hypothetical protein [Chitinophagaceae bacterium]
MRPVRFIFFGNYFYGICAVALSIEASLQQRYPLNNLFYYIAVFSATVLYYTIAYKTDATPDINNKRSVWYAENKMLVTWTQRIFSVIIDVYVIWFLLKYGDRILSLTLTEWMLAAVFPLAGILYYGLNSKVLGSLNLRRIGWLKPFVIGFTWAGLVNVYPVLVHCLEAGTHYQITQVGFFLFIKNFMFVTVLCIMFDIKDYAVDHNLRLKTFVVQNGLRKTIFYILLPLCILGLASFIYYSVAHHFHPMKILLNIVPFAVLIMVAHSMHRRRPILYYL